MPRPIPAPAPVTSATCPSSLKDFGSNIARIAAIADACDGLRGWHDLRTRMSGARLFVQIHAEIDGTLPLKEAHRIGERLRRDILAVGEDVDVIVHQDPV